MAKHPSAFINTIAEGRNFSEAITHLQETWDELQDLKTALRPVDNQDWERLFAMLPDSGHGRFWKERFTELRAALAR